MPHSKDWSVSFKGLENAQVASASRMKDDRIPFTCAERDVEALKLNDLDVASNCLRGLIEAPK